jgi:hypothetical protein
MRWALPLAGFSSSSEYVLTPRHKDLKAGFWTQAHSSRISNMPQFPVVTTRSYSPLFTVFEAPNSKHQTSEKLQKPSIKLPPRTDSAFELEH